MQMATHFSEAIFFVETPTGCILLEDIKLKEVSNTPSMVHQLSPDAQPMDHARAIQGHSSSMDIHDGNAGIQVIASPGWDANGG